MFPKPKTAAHPKSAFAAPRRADDHDSNNNPPNDDTQGHQSSAATHTAASGVADPNGEGIVVALKKNERAVASISTSLRDHTLKVTALLDWGSTLDITSALRDFKAFLVQQDIG